MSLFNDDWTKFQLDCAHLIANADEPPNGVELQEMLRSEYETRINHGQLYPNLDTLVERGIIAKRAVSGSENEYEITSEGRERLVEDLERRDFR